MRIHEPRSWRTRFAWAAIWGFVAAPFAYLIAVLLIEDMAFSGAAFALMFVGIVCMGVLWPWARDYLAAGFNLYADGVHGAWGVDRGDWLDWDDIERLEWHWAPDVLFINDMGARMLDGPTLFARMRDGSQVRLMAWLAIGDRQVQQVNDQLAAAEAAGALPVPFDPTVPPSPYADARPLRELLDDMEPELDPRFEHFGPDGLPRDTD